MNESLLITPFLAKGQLPEFLEDALTVAHNEQSRDMLLLSLLTHCGYAMPAMRAYHGEPRHAYGAELMVMVLAPAGGGKSIISYPRRMMAGIEDNGKTMVYIPANTTAPALVQMLQRVKARGIILANEMDTLSHALRSSHGGFSDILRCLFEHETISQLRIRNGEFIELTDPHVAVLLSGTLNQMRPLIQSRENGLLSRFVCYVASGQNDYNERVWDADDEQPEVLQADALYEHLGRELSRRYLWMKDANHPCYFRFTEAQRKQAKRFFEVAYHAFRGQMDANFEQTLRRMPVIMKRIGMILSGLRLDISQPMPDAVYCDERDFQTIMLMGQRLLQHAAQVFEMLPPIRQTEWGNGHQSIVQKQMIALLPDRFSTREAMGIAQTLGVSGKTAERWLTEWVKGYDIQRISQGVYLKKAS
ncbi:MAG: DUF3987 domain-containing protein [Paludibacteraceae bacterium]